jgi:hypothetical protein
MVKKWSEREDGRSWNWSPDPLSQATNCTGTSPGGADMKQKRSLAVVGRRALVVVTLAGARQGAHGYLQRMVALILFDTPPNLPFSPGFFAGSQTITQTVALHDDDHFTSAGTSAFYRLNGDLDRTGCSTATGHRFE